ncbi:hypothetical protein [Streptomyces avidinii]|uniref:Uncharacterized protein n=1 Tax=Streptomyces avidinii TaxID=1895 RepID=A0ABS4KW41_STRAV|nr:hypothetical protein [Streptomyces avidinii]MBP2034258.1 hypothetical protein [Streptomyces avidinii]GGZ35333.1 hypothetical protein GCM10010343_73260 [Streptomyces avidinii]
MSAAASRRRIRTLALALLGAVVVAGATVPAASAAPAPAPAAAPSAGTAQAAQFWQWGGEYTDRAGAELAGNLMVFSASAVTYYVEYVRQQQYVLWYR